MSKTTRVIELGTLKQQIQLPAFQHIAGIYLFNSEEEEQKYNMFWGMLQRQRPTYKVWRVFEKYLETLPFDRRADDIDKTIQRGYGTMLKTVAKMRELLSEDGYQFQARLYDWFEHLEPYELRSERSRAENESTYPLMVSDAIKELEHRISNLEALQEPDIIDCTYAVDALARLHGRMERSIFVTTNFQTLDVEKLKSFYKLSLMGCYALTNQVLQEKGFKTL